MRKLPAVFGVTAMILAAFLFVAHSRNVSAATSHIVISEIQIAGSSTSDEFVELYNPTSNSIDISGWNLYRKTAAQVTETLVATASGIIPAHGFYLFANSNFNGGITPDKVYSENISSDNSILIRDNFGNLGDLVGLGNSNTKEGTTIDNPIAERSVERKANSDSTEISMSLGGNDEFLGNSEDTDNNFLDFVKHVSPHISQPQGSNSAIEPVLPSDTPTFTPTPTLTPSPTLEPTASPTPTQEPSPTISPTPLPTSTPTPTVTQVLSPTPTPTVLPTPIPSGTIILNSPHLVCYLTRKQVDFFFFKIFMPFVVCSKI
jgi:hypothetical protein